MSAKKLCGRCGNDALDLTPNCQACYDRHRRWYRMGNPRSLYTPAASRCSHCGGPMLAVNPDCTACIKRERKRAKQAGREPVIPDATPRAAAAYPVPITTLAKARDIKNHEALTGWLTARRNRLTPPTKEKKMTEYTTLTGATITTEKLKELALELVNIQTNIATLKEEAARIEAQLKSLPAGKYEAGDATLTVSHPRRFNEKKFTATYSPEAFPQFYQTVQKVNLKALAPALKDEYADDTTARLTIR